MTGVDGAQAGAGRGVSGFGDFIQPFHIEGLGLNGRIVRLGDTVADAFHRHGYPKPVAALHSEAMALTAALSGAIKYEGVFTLQTQGDGPLGLLMCDITSDGDMRAYARFDAEGVESAEEKPGSAVTTLLGAGHLAFTVDQGPDTERYQGITELQDGTIAECAQAYFRQSEQLDAALVVASEPKPEHDGPRAGAMMIQRLPGQAEGTLARDIEDDNWQKAIVLLSSLVPEELLDPGLHAHDILYRLFHDEDVRAFSPRPVAHKCRCSRERVENTLASFPRDEIESMTVDGDVIVTCEFCKIEYRFSEAERETLYERTGKAGS